MITAVRKSLRNLILPVLAATVAMFAALPLSAQESSGVTITVTGRLAYRIAFITPERSQTVNQISLPITIRVQTVGGTPYILPSPATVQLSVNSATGQFLLNPDGTGPVTSVTIPAGASTATFYYRDLTPGTYVIIASETPSQGWIDGSQTVYVTPGGGGGGGGGPPPSPQPEPTPAPEIRPLPVVVSDQQNVLLVRSDGTAVNTVTVSNATRTASITIEAGTRITAESPEGTAVIPDLIEVVDLEDHAPPGPPPPGYVLLSIIYDARAIIGGKIVPVSFDRPVTLIFNWNVLRYPNATDIFVAYYSRDRGWISVQPPPGYVAEYGRYAAQATHFTYYAVFGRLTPAPAPARFSIRNLTVFPKEVRAGESVTITANITNTGGIRGEYIVRLNVPGLLETFQTLSLAPGETQQVRFTVVPGADGTYPVQLGDIGNFFTVTALPSPPPVFTFYWWVYLALAALTAAVLLGIAYGIMVPIRRHRRATAVIRRIGQRQEAMLLKVSDLTVTPAKTSTGNTVTIVAEVANIGENPGTYSMVLKVSGTVEALKEVTLRPGQKEKVAFTLMKDRPGDYEVDLEGLKGRFTILAPVTSSSPAADVGSSS